jgi:biotin carboxylase
MRRVLALLPTNTYRARDVLEAGRALGFEVIVASDRQQALEPWVDDATITIPFDDEAAAGARVDALHARRPLDAVVGLDDETVLPAAQLAQRLGLPGNAPEAVLACRSKAQVRQTLAGTTLRAPSFFTVDRGDIGRAARAVPYPCVLKPTFLSASRGVIRVDDAEQFEAAARRIGRIIDAVAPRHDEAGILLAEEYLPGEEVAVEAIIGPRGPDVLMVFDKPDPLVGPFFQETLYVTPSRHGAEVLDDLAEQLAIAARAMRLTHGALHAEFRLTEEGVYLLELAPRPLGGLCPRVIPLALDMRLESLLLRVGAGEPVTRPRECRPAGVMMIPIPAAGTLEEVRGLDAARAIPGVHDVEISLLPGDEIAPPPEGNRYLGFIFAAGDSVDAVERSLRRAHAALEVRIRDDGAYLPEV